MWHYMQWHHKMGGADLRTDVQTECKSVYVTGPCMQADLSDSKNKSYESVLYKSFREFGCPSYSLCNVYRTCTCITWWESHFK